MISLPLRGVKLTSESPVGLCVICEEEASEIDRVCTRRKLSALTEETRDLREQTKALHCLQASEPPSGVDETMLEAALRYVVPRDPDVDMLWRF